MMSAMPLPSDTTIETAIKITGSVGSLPIDTRSGRADMAHQSMPRNRKTIGTVTMPSAMHKKP